MEFKQNKYLPAEKQIVTADPDVTSVCIAQCIILFVTKLIFMDCLFLGPLFFVKLYKNILEEI